MRDDRELKQLLHPLVAIVLPAGQAAMSALAGGVTVASVAWAKHVDNPLAAGGVAAGVVFGLAWMLQLTWWRGLVENAGASKAARAAPEQVVYPADVVRVELEKPNGDYEWVDYLDLPFERETIIRAAAYLRERDYDTSNMGGAGKPLSRSQAEAIRDWMIGNELAAWVRPEAHTQGWGILPAGRAVIRRLHHLGIATGIVDPPSPKRRELTEVDIYARLHTHTNAQTGNW